MHVAKYTYLEDFFLGWCNIPYERRAPYDKDCASKFNISTLP